MDFGVRRIRHGAWVALLWIQSDENNWLQVSGDIDDGFFCYIMDCLSSDDICLILSQYYRLTALSPTRGSTAGLASSLVVSSFKCWHTYLPPSAKVLYLFV